MPGDSVARKLKQIGSTLTDIDAMHRQLLRAYTEYQSGKKKRNNFDNPGAKKSHT